MEDLRLWFRSPRLNLAVQGDASLSTAEYEGWCLREAYEPNTDRQGTPPGVGRYMLFIERTVSIDDFCEWYAKGVRLTERIEQLWAFVMGWPLGGPRFEYSLRLLSPPKGWETNFKDLERVDMARQGVTGEVKFGRGPLWMISDQFPLPRLHIALSKYPSLDEVGRELIELHYAALNRSHPELILSKALEIVRKNKSMSEQVSGEMPTEVRSALSLKIDDLYRISNTRRETRHVLLNDSSLHPSIHEREEWKEFCESADLLVRFVISKQLGLETVILARGG
jgi:hypothetical protein